MFSSATPPVIDHTIHLNLPPSSIFSIRSSVDSPGGSQEIRPLPTIASSSRPVPSVAASASSAGAPSAAAAAGAGLIASPVGKSVESILTTTSSSAAGGGASSVASAAAFDLDSDFEVEAEAKDWRLNVGREVLDKMSKKEQKRQDVINGESSFSCLSCIETIYICWVQYGVHLST